MGVQNKWRDEGERIKAAQAGDQAAFEELVEVYQSILFNTAYRILAVCRRDLYPPNAICGKLACILKQS